jgi:hypothetical protein
VVVPASGARLSFDLFLDTEETDPLTLEASRDGGATWEPVPFEVRDRGEVRTTDGTVSGSGTRRWATARAELPAGTLALRWRYTTDATNLGRGVVVDGVRVVARDGVVLDGERDADAFTSEGWALVRREAVA